MSKYIDADLYVEMQIYDDEHEEWTWWKGTIEDLLDQWTEEGCPPTIEVSEDCISREYMLEKAQEWKNMYSDNVFARDALTMLKIEIENAPSVIPKRAEGEWLLDGRCSNCLQAPLTTHKTYCPNCGAKMKGAEE